MSALLEFECRPSVGGYRLVAFSYARVGRSKDWRSVTLAPDATEAERYIAKRWGGSVSVGLPVGTEQPRTTTMLLPCSERSRRFDLFRSGPSTFLDFAQTPFTPEGVKAFAGRYGPLASGHTDAQNYEDFLGHELNYWYFAIREMRQAVMLWDKAKQTSDSSKIIRALERRSDERRVERYGPGVGANILLRKDPLSASTRLCIRPTHLNDALWIQLALAIDGSESLRTCVECKKWFTIKSGRGRSDKEYCSTACRMRAYRRRKSY